MLIYVHIYDSFYVPSLKFINDFIHTFTVLWCFGCLVVIPGIFEGNGVDICAFEALTRLLRLFGRHAKFGDTLGVSKAQRLPKHKNSAKWQHDLH